MNGNNHQNIFAYRAVMLFIYNPAAVFYHSVYTQAIYTYITFMFVHVCFDIVNILILQKHQVNSTNISIIYIIIKCVIMLCFSLTIRTTSLFLIPIIALPILYIFFHNLYIVYTVHLTLALKKSIKYLFIGLFTLISIVCTVGMILYQQYNKLCNNQISINGIDRASKYPCNNTGLINVYSYVQKQYWNVGLFTYYQLNNILFIIIGLPVVIFCMIAIPYRKIYNNCKFLISSIQYKNNVYNSAYINKQIHSLIFVSM